MVYFSPPTLPANHLYHRRQYSHQCGRTAHTKNGVTTNHVLGYEMILPDGSVEWFGTNPMEEKMLPD